MFQVLLVGSPMLKKMMGEPILRGWRRWTHGSYDLKLLKRGHATEEARRALRRACEVLSLRANTEEPIAPPRMTWFAIRKIARESGGRPGRMYELVRRALSASIRQGGVGITRRFLFQADALRSPALHPTKVKKAVKAKEKTAEAPVAAREESKQAPQGDVAMRWMRYGLAGLLAVFIVGAGWGVHAWMKASGQESGNAVVAEVKPPETAAPEPPVPQVAEQPSAPVSPVTPAASQVDTFLAQDLAAPSAPAPGGDDIWSPLTTEIAATHGATSSLEQTFASLSPAGSTALVASASSVQPPVQGPVPTSLDGLALQSSEPDGHPTSVASQPPVSPLPSIPEEVTSDTKPQTVAAVTLDTPSPLEGNGKAPEILRLTGPEKALEPEIKPAVTPKSSVAPAKTGAKPRLRKKTLEALARLEKRLN
jgi:hypothetical protein